MGHALRLVPRRTAIVIIDVQRYFLDTPPFAAMRETVRPIANFLPAAREAGITVVHLRTEFLPDLVDAGRLGSRTRQMMDGTGAALVRGAPLTGQRSWHRRSRISSSPRLDSAASGAVG